MDWKPVLRPRRIVTALLVFAFLALGSVAATGLESQPGAPSGPVPASFTLAAPHVGDRGEYTWNQVHLVGETLETGPEHVLQGFEWLPPRMTADWQGRVRDTNQLHEWQWGMNETGAWQKFAEPVWALDRGTRDLVAGAYIHEGMYDMWTVGPAQLYMTNCGEQPLLHGPLPLDRPFRLYGDCAWSSYWTPDNDFRALGTQWIDGQRTILFSNGHASPQQVYVWLADGIPYPVRMVVQDQGDGSRYDVLRLTSFTRGSEPVTWTESSVVREAPSLEWRPAPHMVPSEAGIQHDFPLSKAIDSARGDRNGTLFKEAFDAGYLVSFQQLRASESDGESIEWQMVAFDGKTAAGATVHHFSPAPPKSTDPVEDLLRKVRGEPARGPTNQVTAFQPAPYDWPHPSSINETLPTVASQWARWQAFASTQHGRHSPNDWSMVRAGQAEGWLQLQAGYTLRGHWTNGTAGNLVVPDTRQSEGVIRASHVRDDFSPGRGHEVYFSESDYHYGDAKASPRASAPIGNANELAIVSHTVWVSPSVTLVAGTGLAAAAVALVYLLWPAIKSGALMGLFSRVESDQALAHPQRRRILDLVEAQPGIHLSELARRAGLARTHMEHHLRALERADVVRILASGGYTCVFPRTATRLTMQGAGAVKAEAARRVLSVAVAQPGLAAREVARRTELSPGTVSHHLRRLREAGLVEGAAGAGVLPTAAGRAVLAA